MIGDILNGCLSMIDNLDVLAVFAIFLAITMTFATATSLLLSTFCTTCVIAGIMLGRASLGIAGLNFSTGAVFIATALFGLAVHHDRFGREEAFRALENILFALAIVFGALFLLDRAKLLSPLFDASIRKGGVRFICLYLIQSLAIHLLDRSSAIPTMIRIPAIVMAAEIMEGCIFYPCILLGDRELASVIEFTITSIGIRLMTTMLTVPFLALLLIVERRGGIAKCR